MPYVLSLAKKHRPAHLCSFIVKLHCSLFYKNGIHCIVLLSYHQDCDTLVLTDLEIALSAFDIRTNIWYNDLSHIYDMSVLFELSVITYVLGN